MVAPWIKKKRAAAVAADVTEDVVPQEAPPAATPAPAVAPVPTAAPTPAVVEEALPVVEASKAKKSRVRRSTKTAATSGD
jgi:hypothetical protein